MYQPHNLYFVGRKSEQAHFQQLLAGDDIKPLTILNVHGHSGVGKSWLLEQFRALCSDVKIPFPYLTPSKVSDNPVSLLTGFAQQMELKGEWDADTVAHIFDQLLPLFVTALQALDAPVVMLMLDDYDRLRHFDFQVQHLIRLMAQHTLLHDSNLKTDGEIDISSSKFKTSPRFIVVIGSQTPVREYWPLDPIYLQPLQEMALQDFTPGETCGYLDRMGISREHHQTLSRLTQGYPLALGLVTTLQAWSEADSMLEILESKDRDKLVREIIERTLRLLEDDPLRSQVVELLYASVVVRRFDRFLLAAMLNQPSLPDTLFDRVTALSMVTERSQIGQPRMFILHNALQLALLEDAEGKGLEKRLKEYRRRALAFYTIQQAKMEQAEAITELWLDILFLHSSPLIHKLFFDWASAPMAIEPASFDELDDVLDSLMRRHPLYQQISFEGELLEQFIQQTHKWLALDRELHGETCRYFQVARRSDAQGSIAGFVFNVPLTAKTQLSLRHEFMGEIYELAGESLAIRKNERRFFLLRLVFDEWDSIPSLLRTIFTQLMRTESRTLIAVVPWRDIISLLQDLGFETLAQDIKYKGYEYSVTQLDTMQYGGAVKWLLQLVRHDVGLPAGRLVDDWELFKATLQEALERLHSPVKLLTNPLINEFNLASQDADDWKRGQALIDTLQEVVETMRLSTGRDQPDSAFHVLNESYGVVDEAWQRFEYGTPPTIKEISQSLCVSPRTYYNRQKEALEALARTFRRRVEGP